MAGETHGGAMNEHLFVLPEHEHPFERAIALDDFGDGRLVAQTRAAYADGYFDQTAQL